MALIRSMPVLQVSDVVKSAAFYEKLGFEGHGFWGDPPGFAIMQRGFVTIALDRTRQQDAIPRNQWWAAYVYVDDVAALHAQFVAGGVSSISEPQKRDYGCEDFDVVDPDGHRIAFGQDLYPDPPGPGLRPAQGGG